MQGVSTPSSLPFKPEGEGGTKRSPWAMYGKNERSARQSDRALSLTVETMCGPEFEKGLADVAKLVTTP